MAELITKLSCFTSEEVNVLEEHTRGQNQNADWNSQRVGRITASIIHRVKTKVNSLKKCSDTSSAIPLVKLLTGQVPRISSECIPSLRYGQQMEGEARVKYENEMKLQGHKDIKVQSCGLFILQDKPYIGASPDGLVSCSCCGEGLLEIKCPFSIANQSPLESNLVYLERDCNGCVIGLRRNHPYYSQVQAQMGVLGRCWCDFFIYTRHGFYRERIKFDQECWKELVKAAHYFFVEYVAPALLQFPAQNAETVPSCSLSNNELQYVEIDA